jgi:hypothetical protein
MIMPNLRTSCARDGGILNGSISIDSDGNVTSYVSTNGGTGDVNNINPNSSNLNFNVRFGTSNKVYPISAIPDGRGGWDGDSDPPAGRAAVEPWCATAVE